MTSYQKSVLSRTRLHFLFMHRKDLQLLCHKCPLNRSCPETLLLRQNIIIKVTYKRRYWIEFGIHDYRVNGIRQSGMACLRSSWEHTSWSRKPRAKREKLGMLLAFWNLKAQVLTDTHPPIRPPFLIPSKQFHQLRKYLNI